jgi:hypothetical protein
MREFFHGWRRKAGIATLLVALLFMAGWIRSFVVEDYFALPFEFEIGGRTLVGLAAENQSLVFYADALESESDLEPDPVDTPLADTGATIPDAGPARQEDEPADALSVISEAESVADEWVQVGGPISVSSQSITITCMFPLPVPLVSVHFGWIVLPLTLLSGWLILWKPRQFVSSRSEGPDRYQG